MVKRIGVANIFRMPISFLIELDYHQSLGCTGGLPCYETISSQFVVLIPLVNGTGGSQLTPFLPKLFKLSLFQILRRHYYMEFTICVEV